MMDLFFAHFVCFATVGTPALIRAPPSRENNELNPQKKRSTHKTMKSLKSCAILSKDIVSFGSGHQYSLREAKTDGKQPALCFSA